MRGILLDTDIIIDWLRGREGIAAWLQRRVATGVELCVTGITVAEIVSGAPEDKQDERQRQLTAFRYLPLSFDAATMAGQLRREHLSAGRPIALPDLLQAAIALTEGCIVATANTKHFPDVETINPRVG